MYVSKETLVAKRRMKMFGFIKEIFLIRSLFLSSLVSTNPLSCISMIDQACNITPEIINVNSNEPVFIILVLKQLNLVVAVTISMIHLQKYVFLML